MSDNLIRINNLIGIWKLELIVLPRVQNDLNSRPVLVPLPDDYSIVDTVLLNQIDDDCYTVVVQ